MPLAHPQQILDPAEFTIVPHTAVVDEFRMTGQDGSFVADITPAFLANLVAHMKEREELTGDLCPIVIGHTIDGVPEVDQPPLIGYCRNWHIGELGTTGRQAAFCDLWVFTSRVEQAKNYPRRSAEVWASRYEVDPLSLLGATTPARDLGLMKLSREGSFTFFPQGDTAMPSDDKPKADPKETGTAKKSAGEFDELKALLSQILEAVTGGAGAGAGKAPPDQAPPSATPGAGAGDGEMSDEEYEQLMQSLMQGEHGGAGKSPPEDEKKSRAGEKPTENKGGMKDEDEYACKMSRLEQRLADQAAELARMQVKDRLVKLARPDIADPDDGQFVEDLVSMEPTMRERALERIAKSPRAPGQGSTHLSRALENADSTGRGKRMTQPDVVRLSRKAAEKNAKGEKTTFEAEAIAEGFTIPGM